MKSTPTISTPLQEISRLRILPTTLLGQRRNSLTKRKRMVSRCRLPSQVTLFTPWNKEYGHLPPVLLNGDAIPQANNPKLLGVTLDLTYTFSAHASAVARKARSRLGILRALLDTAFGHDKEFGTHLQGAHSSLRLCGACHLSSIQQVVHPPPPDGPKTADSGL